MKNIEYLHDTYVKAKFSLSEWSSCVDWAVQSLLNDEDQDDEEVILLASSSSEEEIRELTEAILANHLTPGERDDEYWAGKYVVHLHSLFYDQKIDIFELESRLWKIYYKLDCPGWLTMLSRNCEYATDVPAFEKPFKDEFEYIVGLWKKSNNIDFFKCTYDRNISNSHDAM